MRRRFIIGLLLLFGVFSTAVCYVAFYTLKQPLLLHGQASSVFEVKPKMTAAMFAYALAEKKLVQSPIMIIRFLQLKRLSTKIKAGIYEIQSGDTLGNFLDAVIAGRVLTKSLTIVEGTTLSMLRNQLKRAPFLTNDFTSFSFMAGSYPGPEGLLLADTYAYNAGTDARTLLDIAQANLFTFLDQAWKKRDLGLPYKSSYELLIAASILEKETADPLERQLISSVIVNRLRKNMPLQMDPTVIYALNTQFQGKLHRHDLSIDSPYNTYKYRGLPPTPIAIVGKDAIEAAAHPAASNYLYFVAKGDGSHVFSTSYDHQRLAVDKYQKRKNNDYSHR